MESPKLIQKVLIANRGEIAIRVMRTCKRLGISTVAVYSEADRNTPHVKAADEAVFIGAAPASDSYLRMDKLIEAAKKVNAHAIHPGYGFLSENPDFARACSKNGIIFIGPLPDTMHMLGNKQVVKNLMKDKCPDVPLIPGYTGEDQSNATLRREAERIGFPVLFKAAAGGGGKGMRIAHKSSDIDDCISSVKSEGKNSFGSEKMLLERYFTSCRHIEIQIFGDEHGNVIHLAERDCSVQRRYQKVIEETPSTFVTDDLRGRMGQAAVTIGKMCNYIGAGTVEFLVDHERNFYFLEVNTRLQVEHPITEMIQGLDLVQLQLLVAQGYSLESLSLLPHQRETLPRPGPALPTSYREHEAVGHAIECRLYAEDPANNFFPCTGLLQSFIPYEGPGIRYDTGVTSGSEISVYYDPLVAKVITYGATRAIALQRMIAALRRSVVLGVTTNKKFLLDALSHPAFVKGDYDTRFIGMYFKPDQLKRTLTPQQTADLAMVATCWDWQRRTGRRPQLRHIPSGFGNATRSKQRTILSVNPSVALASGYDEKSSNQVLVEYVKDNSYVRFDTPAAQAPEGRVRPPTFQMAYDVDPNADPIPVVEKKKGLHNADYPSKMSKSVTVSMLSCDPSGAMVVEIDGRRQHYFVVGPKFCSVGNSGTGDEDEIDIFVHSADVSCSFKRRSRFAVAGAVAGGGNDLLLSPIPCKILKVVAKQGEHVNKGDLAIVVESMKMEMKLYAEASGIAEVFVKEGQIVKDNTKLIHFKSQDAE